MGCWTPSVAHGVTLQQIQVSGSITNASDTVVTAQVPGIGVVKFGFDKMEVNLANFTQAFFETSPQTMKGLTAWVAKAIPDFKFASHSFSYFSHSFVKDATPQEVLKALNVRELRSAGITLAIAREWCDLQLRCARQEMGDSATD